MYSVPLKPVKPAPLGKASAELAKDAAPPAPPASAPPALSVIASPATKLKPVADLAKEQPTPVQTKTAPTLIDQLAAAVAQQHARPSIDELMHAKRHTEQTPVDEPPFVAPSVDVLTELDPRGIAVLLVFNLTAARRCWRSRPLAGC